MNYLRQSLCSIPCYIPYSEEKVGLLLPVQEMLNECISSKDRQALNKIYEQSDLFVKRNSIVTINNRKQKKLLSSSISPIGTPLAKSILKDPQPSLLQLKESAFFQEVHPSDVEKTHQDNIFDYRLHVKLAKGEEIFKVEEVKRKPKKRYPARECQCCGKELMRNHKCMHTLCERKCGKDSLKRGDSRIENSSYVSDSKDENWSSENYSENPNLAKPNKAQTRRHSSRQNQGSSSNNVGYKQGQYPSDYLLQSIEKLLTEQLFNSFTYKVIEVKEYEESDEEMLEEDDLDGDRIIEEIEEDKEGMYPLQKEEVYNLKEQGRYKMKEQGRQPSEEQGGNLATNQKADPFLVSGDNARQQSTTNMKPYRANESEVKGMIDKSYGAQTNQQQQGPRELAQHSHHLKNQMESEGLESKRQSRNEKTKPDLKPKMIQYNKRMIQISKSQTIKCPNISNQTFTAQLHPTASEDSQAIRLQKDQQKCSNTQDHLLYANSYQTFGGVLDEENGSSSSDQDEVREGELKEVPEPQKKRNNRKSSSSVPQGEQLDFNRSQQQDLGEKEPQQMIEEAQPRRQAGSQELRQDLIQDQQDQSLPEYQYSSNSLLEELDEINEEDNEAGRQYDEAKGQVSPSNKNRASKKDQKKVKILQKSKELVLSQNIQEIDPIPAQTNQNQQITQFTLNQTSTLSKPSRQSQSMEQGNNEAIDNQRSNDGQKLGRGKGKGRGVGRGKGILQEEIDIYNEDSSLIHPPSQPEQQPQLVQRQESIAPQTSLQSPRVAPSTPKRHIPNMSEIIDKIKKESYDQKGLGRGKIFGRGLGVLEEVQELDKEGFVVEANEQIATHPRKKIKTDQVSRDSSIQHKQLNYQSGNPSEQILGSQFEHEMDKFDELIEGEAPLQLEEQEQSLSPPTFNPINTSIDQQKMSEFYKCSMLKRQSLINEDPIPEEIMDKNLSESWQAEQKQLEIPEAEIQMEKRKSAGKSTNKQRDLKPKSMESMQQMDQMEEVDQINQFFQPEQQNRPECQKSEEE